MGNVPPQVVRLDKLDQVVRLLLSPPIGVVWEV